MTADAHPFRCRCGALQGQVDPGGTTSRVVCYCMRWYAACCRTPLGNTMTRRTMPFTDLLLQCLDSAPVEPAFGPVLATANTQSALGDPKPHPFFNAAGAPVAQVTVLSADERARLDAQSPTA